MFRAPSDVVHSQVVYPVVFYPELADAAVLSRLAESSSFHAQEGESEIDT